jgi:cytochrome-b5 reductase
MIQALHAILGDTTSSIQPKVTMLYGSRTSNDILGREIIDEWTARYPERFECVYVLSHEPDDGPWTGPRGFITQELIATKFDVTSTTPTDASQMIFLCGPPPMYDHFCGPRTEKEVTGVLGSMGYTADQVYKF